MGKALYRTYRSRNFDDVVGQDHITSTLKKALKSGRVSHAYLFTGPRGVGKTSVARILAHEINNLSYSDDEIHLDIIEIDAASNRRIDEIRDLRDKVHIVPTSAKYKVYIIDEVHMLTKEAFNALLKTLEEPPDHCIFILATTELNKVPATIVSRTQRFTFKPIDREDAIDRLNLIAETEKISVTKEALDLIAASGQGSFRDSVSLLDQLGGRQEEITADTVRELLGLPHQDLIQDIYKHVKQSDSSELLSCLQQVREQSMNVNLVAGQISELIRLDIAKSGIQDWQVQLLKNLTTVSSSLNQYSTLEVALLEASSTDGNSFGSSSREYQIPQSDSVNMSETKESTDLETKRDLSSEIDNNNASFGEFLNMSWQKILDSVKKEAASTYTALRLAEPVLDETSGILTLNFQFPLHQKKVDTAKSKKIIADRVEELTGKKLIIKCVVDKNVRQPQLEHAESIPGDIDDSMESISNIFGSAEVIESGAID